MHSLHCCCYCSISGTLLRKLGHGAVNHHLPILPISLQLMIVFDIIISTTISATTHNSFYFFQIFRYLFSTRFVLGLLFASLMTFELFTVLSLLMFLLVNERGVLSNLVFSSSLFYSKVTLLFFRMVHHY